MFEGPLQRTSRGFAGRTQDAQPRELDELKTLLLGAHADVHALPATTELLTAVIALCQGARRKALLPVASQPMELALVRHGDSVLASYYGSDGAPEVVVHERSVHLPQLLSTLCRAAIALSHGRASLEARSVTNIAQSALSMPITEVGTHARVATRSGGVVEEPESAEPLVFGFAASIPTTLDSPVDTHAFADVHALLFQGELWAYSRGRRFTVARGPLMLTAQRMVHAVRALVDAWQARKEMNIRLCAGDFSIAMRLDREQQVAITLSSEAAQPVTVPALSVAEATLPILRLALDLIRALTSVDRPQARNLRVTSLRSEVRLLRRVIRSRDELGGFENEAADRLRISNVEMPAITSETTPTASSSRAPAAARGRLSFRERWHVEIDGLDASSTFLCGDRLVICTPRMSVAIARDTGDVIWSQLTTSAHAAMVGRTLLRITPQGEIQLSDVDDGVVYARTQIGQRATGVQRVISAGGGDLPPMAVMNEGRNRLLAIDVRTGEPRWRYRARQAGAFEWRRAGRVILVVCGDGSLDALDAASGEVVWRSSDQLRFCTVPAVSRDRVIALSGELGSSSARLHCIDLFSGKKLWQRDLAASPASAPLDAGERVLLAIGARSRAQLAAFDVSDGQERWCVRDPGLAAGAAVLALDPCVIFNSASGRVTAINHDNGETRWSQQVSNPLTDDVARHLDVVLRHGALFVPASRVHVLRPQDGESLMADNACDLVPDFLRVDERGWFYVGEESGHVRAYGPAPRLSLVK